MSFHQFVNKMLLSLQRHHLHPILNTFLMIDEFFELTKVVKVSVKIEQEIKEKFECFETHWDFFFQLFFQDIIFSYYFSINLSLKSNFKAKLSEKNLLVVLQSFKNEWQKISEKLFCRIKSCQINFQSLKIIFRKIMGRKSLHQQHGMTQRTLTNICFYFFTRITWDFKSSWSVSSPQDCCWNSIEKK